MAVKIFRWKALGPLALFLAIVAILLWLFAEPLAQDTTEEVGTELLGTEVDIGKLDIRANEARVDLQALEIADPFNLASRWRATASRPKRSARCANGRSSSMFRC
jgi:hypothetical protein